MTPPQPVAIASQAIAAESVAERGAWAMLATDVAQLVRPKIALMVLATVATGFWLTAGRPADVRPLLWLLVGTALVAASSSVANQVLERRTDRLMPRTADRPLAAGRLTVAGGWALAAVLLVVGTAISVVAGGWPATAAALATWLLYVAAYTPLKRMSPLNTAVGAVVVTALVGLLAWVNGGAASPARRWSWLLAALVVCQIVLGCGAWVVAWGLPSGLLPEAWRLSEAIQARSTAGAAVVTGHVVLGMLILGGAVVLWLVSGGLRGAPQARSAGLRGARREGVFA